MRDKWYGDNRDLVKWGTLLALADRHAARHILQVAYWRPTDWPGLEIEGEPTPIPEAVLRHFRRASAADEIVGQPRVEVLLDRVEERRDYLEKILARVRGRTEKPGLVFLDPDTGLAPRHATLDHVLESEVASVWNTLDPGDVLVFYQHQTNRDGAPWIPPKKAQFERAVGLRPGAAGLARGPKLARDVALFYAIKPGGLQGVASRCRCCHAGLPFAGRRTCPECGHVFRGHGWDGIDAHWRSRHESEAPYEAFWRTLCRGHRGADGD